MEQLQQIISSTHIKTYNILVVLFVENEYCKIANTTVYNTVGKARLKLTIGKFNKTGRLININKLNPVHINITRFAWNWHLKVSCNGRQSLKSRFRSLSAYFFRRAHPIEVCSDELRHIGDVIYHWIFEQKISKL